MAMQRCNVTPGSHRPALPKENTSGGYWISTAGDTMAPILPFQGLIVCEGVSTWWRSKRDDVTVT